MNNCQEDMPSNRSHLGHKRGREDELKEGLQALADAIVTDSFKDRVYEGDLTASQISWAAQDIIRNIPFTQKDLAKWWVNRSPSPQEALYMLLKTKPFKDDLMVAMELVRMCYKREYNARLNVGDNVWVNRPTSFLIALLSNRTDLAELIRKNSVVVRSCINTLFPSHWCVKVNNLDGIRLLAAHRADLNLKDDDGQSPMHLAAKNGNLDAVELLLNLGAFINLLNNDSKTAWRLACEGGHKDVALLLVSKGAYPDYVCNGNHHPLAEATAVGDLDLMRIMLQCGANVNARVVRNGYALSQAIIKHNLEAVLLLLDWGADVNIDAPLCLVSRNYKNDPCDSDSMYEDASDLDDDWTLATFLKVRTGRIFRAVVDYDSDDEDDAECVTSNPILAICEALISLGADINSKSFTGMTPLRIALNGKSTRRAKLLRAHGGNPQKLKYSKQMSLQR